MKDGERQREKVVFDYGQADVLLTPSSEKCLIAASLDVITLLSSAALSLAPSE